jgi:hypothetical protein
LSHRVRDADREIGLARGHVVNQQDRDREPIGSRRIEEHLGLHRARGERRAVELDGQRAHRACNQERAQRERFEALGHDRRLAEQRERRGPRRRLVADDDDEVVALDLGYHGAALAEAVGRGGYWHGHHGGHQTRRNQL